MKWFKHLVFLVFFVIVFSFVEIHEKRREVLLEKNSKVSYVVAYGFDKNGMNILVAADGDTGNLPIPLPNGKVFDSKSKISWSLANEKNFMKWDKIGEVALVAAAVAGMVILILDDGTII